MLKRFNFLKILLCFSECRQNHNRAPFESMLVCLPCESIYMLHMNHFTLTVLSKKPSIDYIPIRKKTFEFEKESNRHTSASKASTVTTISSERQPVFIALPG